MSSDTSTLDAYDRLATPFGAVVDRLSPADWQADSPCAGWSARDVLAHVIRSQRTFLADRGVDATTADDLDADPSSDPAEAWRVHRDRMRELLADPAVAGMEYDGVFGRTTVGASIIAFHGFDLVVHRWDIATAAGLDERFTDDELDMIERSADGFGDHLYDDGVCAPALPAPDGADRQGRLLARLGRRVPAQA